MILAPNRAFFGGLKFFLKPPYVVAFCQIFWTHRCNSFQLTVFFMFIQAKSRTLKSGKLLPTMCGYSKGRLMKLGKNAKKMKAEHPQEEPPVME